MPRAWTSLFFPCLVQYDVPSKSRSLWRPRLLTRLSSRARRQDVAVLRVLDALLPPGWRAGASPPRSRERRGMTTGMGRLARSYTVGLSESNRKLTKKGCGYAIWTVQRCSNRYKHAAPRSGGPLRRHLCPHSCHEGNIASLDFPRLGVCLCSSSRRKDSGTEGKRANLRHVRIFLPYGSGEDRATRWVMTSQTVEGLPQPSRYAAGCPPLVYSLILKVIQVMLGSLMLLGSGLLRCTVGSEEAMPPREGPSPVYVTTDKSSYRSGESIIVNVVNSLSVPIYALTGQTYCTIVTVQRSVEGQWSAEGRCLVFAPPGWVEIAAGGHTVVEVRPRLPSDRPLAPGRYRVMLSFKAGSTSGPSATVFSSEFLISDPGHVP
jgi:hypothetical protein